MNNSDCDMGKIAILNVSSNSIRVVRKTVKYEITDKDITKYAIKQAEVK